VTCSREIRFRLAALAAAALLAAIPFLPLPGTVRWPLFGALALAGLWLSLRVAWWWPRVPANLPVFLMLHSVSDTVVDAECPNNTLRPAELDTLIGDLLAAGYVFQTVPEAVDAPARRSVVLTFDDGWADNYTDLFPILRRRNVKATCFITNRGDRDPAFLTPGQIREMAASGLVAFGGHTAEHDVLDILSDSEAEASIRANRDWLAGILGAPPDCFAYPKGRHTDATIAILKRCGYRCAVTMRKKMRPVAEDPFRIRRQIIPRGHTPCQLYLLATRGKCRV